ncbi:MAG: DUF6174 domain-containing protein [Gemmatimonadaceae bacterium]
MTQFRSRLFSLTRAVVTMVLCGACMVFVGPADRDDDFRELVAARARWNTNGVTDYEVSARALCFCALGGQTVRVTVRGGRVTSAIVVNTGEPVSANLVSVYRSVEQLFDVIEDAVRNRAHRIDATYDAQYGFPTHFVIDYVENAVDEEFGYEIVVFNPMLTR